MVPGIISAATQASSDITLLEKVARAKDKGKIIRGQSSTVYEEAQAYGVCYMLMKTRDILVKHLPCRQANLAFLVFSALHSLNAFAKFSGSDFQPTALAILACRSW